MYRKKYKVLLQLETFISTLYVSNNSKDFYYVQHFWNDKYKVSQNKFYISLFLFFTRHSNQCTDSFGYTIVKPNEFCI